MPPSNISWIVTCRPPLSVTTVSPVKHGAFSLAVLNMSRTRLAPTPTNIWMNSEPLIEKNGTPASPATARASSVLPVPGGPTSSTPLGTTAPRRWNFSGLLRNSTISCNSPLACSMSATSSKVTRNLLRS